MCFSTIRLLLQDSNGIHLQIRRVFFSLRYVVENMLPISTVEDPAFRQIISMVPCTGNNNHKM